MGVHEVLAGLSDNPYFSAGFGLMGLGTGLAVMKVAWRQGLVFARRQLLVSLEIPSRDRSYGWVLQWISKQNTLGVGGASTGLKTQHLSVQTTVHQFETGRIETRFDFMPSPGRHILLYKNTLIFVQREREKQMIDLHSGTPWESVTLTTLRRRNTNIFNDLLEEAKQMAVQKEEGKVVIYTNWGMEWRPFGQPRRRRPLDSVILADCVSETLLRDMQDFTESSKWYIDRGIPYRRGYLLYGPPGSGKSSFIQALAGELQYNICVLNLAERGLTDDRLNQAMAVLPERSIILLEDVDAVFSKNRDDKYGSQVTFSGLLNTLDGVVSTEQRIVFMTTNHIERLDPALLRPGRVDLKLYIGDASPEQMRRMYLRFYDKQETLATKFVQKVQEEGKTLSMAQLQGHFMFHKNDPVAAIDNISKLEKATENESKTPPVITTL